MEFYSLFKEKLFLADSSRILQIRIELYLKHKLNVKCFIYKHLRLWGHDYTNKFCVSAKKEEKGLVDIDA